MEPVGDLLKLGKTSWKGLAPDQQKVVLDAEIAQADRALAGHWGDTYVRSSAPAREAAAATPIRTPILDDVTTDLTAQAREGQLKASVGRELAVQQLIGILQSKSPVILGEAGVGKSALVEALAQRIASGDVPEYLKGKRILTLNLDAFHANTKYTGELSTKFKALEAELRGSPDTILFIDELHRAASHGEVDGVKQDSLLEKLKPALGRQEVTLIGATTLDEFRAITKDPALERRFVPVNLEEPSVVETKAILKGHQARLEAENDVRFDPATLQASVDYAGRYLPELHRPAGPLGLMEQAAGRVALRDEMGPPELLELQSRLAANQAEQADLRLELEDPKRLAFVQRKLAKLEEQAAGLSAQVRAYDDQIAQEHYLQDQLRQLETSAQPILDKARSAAQAGQLEEAHALLSGDEYRGLAERAQRYEATLTAFEEGPLGRLTGRTVHPRDVAAVLQNQKHIPVLSSEGEKQRLLDMETPLKRRVVGQDDAVNSLAKSVRLAAAGLTKPNQPRSASLFLGPTGTGKTELAKALAEFMFGDENAMVRLDMGEYTEKHSVSRLVGAPPGYVGYEAGGQLTEAVRKNPHTVLLFDEVEKAHPEVFNTLLQLLEDGRLTDGQGKTVDFKHVHVVMTSNLKPEELKKFFKPEFLNRFKEIVQFKPLGEDQMLGIADKFLEGTRAQLAEQFIDLEVTPEAKAYLAKKGFDPEFGARPMDRTIRSEVGDSAADLILADKVGAGGQLVVSYADGALKVEAQPAAPAAEANGAGADPAPEAVAPLDLAASPEFQAWRAAQGGQAGTPEAPAKADAAPATERVVDPGDLHSQTPIGIQRSVLQTVDAAIGAPIVKTAQNQIDFAPALNALTAIKSATDGAPDEMSQVMHELATRGLDYKHDAWVPRAAARVSALKAIHFLATSTGSDDARLLSAIGKLARDGLDNPLLSDQAPSPFYTANTGQAGAYTSPLMRNKDAITFLAQHLSTGNPKRQALLALANTSVQGDFNTQLGILQPLFSKISYAV